MGNKLNTEGVSLSPFKTHFYFYQNIHQKEWQTNMTAFLKKQGTFRFQV
jgi:hypothetical protein